MCGEDTDQVRLLMEPECVCACWFPTMLEQRVYTHRRL